MTTVRASRVVNTSHSEPKMWTLWECEPEHQKVLEAWVAGYRQVWDRGDGPDTALAWKDFSSAQALEEANQRLHDAQWLDEVDMMLSDNLMCEEQIAVTGGTGTYTTAQGELTVFEEGEGQSRYTFDLLLSPSK